MKQQCDISRLDYIQRRMGHNGYVYLRIEYYWITEHRYVMEQYLGRKLTDEERVHHDDFNRENNNISNLTLFPNNSAHSHFHRQLRQFGMTQPRRTELRILKEKMQEEHNARQTQE